MMGGRADLRDEFIRAIKAAQDHGGSCAEGGM